jgi:hypothetical protein
MFLRTCAIVISAISCAHAMPGGGATIHDAGQADNLPNSRQQAGRRDHTRMAQNLGLDNAVARRTPSCIRNDLRSECQADQTTIGQTGQFYVDWNRSTRRCVIVVGKPIIYNVVGGGPFETRSEAKAAIKTIKGC